MRSYAKPALSRTWTDQQLAEARGGGKKNLPGTDLAVLLGELSGGYIQSDLDAFADANGIPHFTVTDVSVDGITNNSHDATEDASGEVALDIQRVVGRYFAETGKVPRVVIAWGQSMPQITQYFADHPEEYIVLSWSWGAPESAWSTADIQAYTKASAQAVANGQVICAASGDNGPGDGLSGLHVDMPSSDVNTVACGGTTKTADQEALWGTNANDGPGEGAGYSSLFTAPFWQTFGTMRSVPDILEVADPNTGYDVYVAGQVQQIGGTSASAPAVAGYLAALGTRFYNFLPAVWANPAVFTEVVYGVDGEYKGSSAPGPGNGLGTINADKFKLLSFAQAPGTPVQRPNFIARMWRLLKTGVEDFFRLDF